MDILLMLRGRFSGFVASTVALPSGFLFFSRFSGLFKGLTEGSQLCCVYTQCLWFQTVNIFDWWSPVASAVIYCRGLLLLFFFFLKFLLMLSKRDAALAPLMGNSKVHTNCSLSSNASANGRKAAVKDNLKRPPLTQPVDEHTHKANESIVRWRWHQCKRLFPLPQAHGALPVNIPSQRGLPPGWPGRCLCYWSQSAVIWLCPSGFPAACLCLLVAPAGSQSGIGRLNLNAISWRVVEHKFSLMALQ